MGNFSSALSLTAPIAIGDGNIHNTSLMHQGNGLQSSILTPLLEHSLEDLIDVYRRYDEVLCVLNGLCE